MAEDLQEPFPRQATAEIPIVRITAQQAADTFICTICITEFNESEEASALSCAHYYHPSCIEQWLEDSVSCPICRKPVDGMVEEPYETESDSEDDDEPPALPPPPPPPPVPRTPMFREYRVITPTGRRSINDPIPPPPPAPVDPQSVGRTTIVRTYPMITPTNRRSITETIQSRPDVSQTGQQSAARSSIYRSYLVIWPNGQQTIEDRDLI